MKRLLTLLACILAVSGAATTAHAEFFAVNADLPVYYDFEADELDVDGVNGYSVGLNTPFFLGVAYENYTVKGGTKTTDSLALPLDYEMAVTMYDLFLEVPFPGLNLGAGFGVGQGDFSVDDSTLEFDDATLNQAFIRVGIPFALLFDVHVGYHAINGETEVTSGGVGEIDLDANMATIGVKIGF